MAKFKKNINKKESIIEALQELQRSVGWEIMVRALDKDIELLQMQLDAELDKDTQDANKVRNIHYKKKSFELLKDFPASLIETVVGSPEVPLDLDPYE